MDTITVIIPVFNRHDTIKSALKSVYDQEWDRSKLNIIVSDDGSEQPFSYLESEFNNLKVIRSEHNRGAGVARQRALDITDSKWVVFLDSDDILTENFFTFIDDEYSMICTKVLVLEQDGSSHSDDISNLALHGIIYKKSALDKYNIRFDNNLRILEDMYFQKLCYKLIPDPLIKKVNLDGYVMQLNPYSTVSQFGRRWYLYFIFEKCYAVTEYLKICDSMLTSEEIRDDINELFNTIFMRYKYYDDNSFYIIFDYLKKKYNFDNSDKIISYLNSDLANNSLVISTIRKRYDKYENPKREKILLSIIIPLYNSHKYISKIIENLYKNIGKYIEYVEVILTDDNSEDPDYSYLSHYKNIRIINNDKNVMQGMNRNRGIEASIGKWVVFMDHDDEGITAEAFDEFFSIPNVNMKYNMIIGNAYVNEAHTQLFAPHRYIELCHGVFFKKSFLDKYQIRFTEKLNRSEDFYLKQRAILSLIIANRENTVLISDTTFYKWSYNPTSQFNTIYNDRCFEEEFFGDNVLCTILALKESDAPEYLWKTLLLRSLSANSFAINGYSQYSANFKRDNARYLLFILIILRKYFKITDFNDLELEYSAVMEHMEYIYNKYSTGFANYYSGLDYIRIIYNIYERLNEDHIQEIVNQMFYLGIDLEEIGDHIT